MAAKVVFIPKPNKDHKAAKDWRPINLINCIGKLAEEVVADELQEPGLLHKASTEVLRDGGHDVGVGHWQEAGM